MPCPDLASYKLIQAVTAGIGLGLPGGLGLLLNRVDYALALTYRADILRRPVIYRSEIVMDVKTLCLGLLTQGAASGYDLKKRFETCFRSFYSAGYGSIYPALAYLADTDLVTC